jgi:hypothetical protein
LKPLAPSLPTVPIDELLIDCHILVTGGTRRGKTAFATQVARRNIAKGLGTTIIDPHGSYARDVRDWIANPTNGQHHRIVQFIEPGSPNVIGLNPIATYDDSWEACHDAALTLASVVEGQFQASPEQTPLLALIIYVAAFICARHKLTLLEVLEVLSLGGDELRRTLLEDFDNRVVRRELEALHTLALRSPREFLALVQSAKNRFVRWLGSPAMARSLGLRRGLNPLTVMDESQVVICDLSSLAYADAAFYGGLLSAMYFAAAKRRAPLTSPMHRIFLDESESMLTINTARGCDQVAKYGLTYLFCVQRLGQLRARGDFIADALFVNCTAKVSFGGLEPDSARYMAETLYGANVPLEEPKPDSFRQVPVGNEKVIVRGTSRAQHHAHSTATATSSSRSRGEMHAIGDVSAFASGSALSTGTSSAISALPDAGPITAPTPLSTNMGRNSATAATRSASRARSTTSARHLVEANATSTSHGEAHGRSLATSETEAFVTVYENLPTAYFTLEEQLFRLAGMIATLPRRECVVRFEDRPPVHARTADLTPAFRSAVFRDTVLPLYMARINRTSGYVHAAADVDREIAGRIDALIAASTPNEPDFAAPEPTPRLRIVRGDNDQ